MNECFWVENLEKSVNLSLWIDPPNQPKDDFGTFTGKLELKLNKIFDNNPFLVAALGDFNAKSDP